MSSLYEITARAAQIASGRRGASERSPVLDADITSEALFDHALRYVYAKRLRSGEGVQDLMRSHTITFVKSIGTLPANVLRPAIRYGYIPDTLASYTLPSQFSRRNRFSETAGKWTVEGDTVKYTPPGETEYDGDADFFFITMPNKETGTEGYKTDLDLDRSVVDDIVLIMAGALTGEIPLDEILDNQI